MKINKAAKKVVVENAWRPPPKFKRDFTVCRITEGSLISDEPVFKIQVDADRHEDFWAKISALPENEKYYCGVFEMFFTLDKHLDPILEWSKEHYDVVIFEDITGKVEVVKKHEKNQASSTTTR